MGIIKVSDLQMIKHPDTYLQNKAKRNVEQTPLPTDSVAIIALKRENAKLRKENENLKNKNGSDDQVKELEEENIRLKNEILQLKKAK